MLMMGELIAFFKSVIIILLKLVLLFLKKRHSKEQNLSENDTTNDSGFGSHSPSSREDEAFELSSELDAEIGRLRTENKALRDIMSKEHHGPRSDFNRNAVKSLCSRRGTSLTDMSHHVDFVTSTPRSAAPDVAVHDVVCQKLMLKLQLEREENDRLQNYINDIMYIVLENRQSLLEK